MRPGKREMTVDDMAKAMTRPRMGRERAAYIALVALAVLILPVHLFSAERQDGQPLKSPLGFQYPFHKESSLRASTWTIDPQGSPAKLNGAGVGLADATGIAGRVEWRPTGRIFARKPLRAVEVRVVLLDLFGDHFRTISAYMAQDMEEGKAYELPEGPGWRAPYEEAERFGGVLAFVARSLDADGEVWRADLSAVLEEARQAGLDLDESMLLETRRCCE